MILIQKFAVTVEIYFCMVIVRRYFEGLEAQTCLKEGRACLFEYGRKTVLMEERSKRIASGTSMMKKRMSSSRVRKRRGGRKRRRIPEISSRSKKGRLHTLLAREFHCVWRRRRGGKGIDVDATSRLVERVKMNICKQSLSNLRATRGSFHEGTK